MSTFIIAEIGVNHNGDLELARRLVDGALESGADAVKFQTFDASKLAAEGAKKASYQESAGDGHDQREMLSQLELSEDAHRELYAYCDKAGIEFMSTPFDLDSADFLVNLGVRRLKLPSGDIDNLPMIRRYGSYDLPVIMSTGMANMDDIAFGKASLEKAWEAHGSRLPQRDRLTLLHCTSNYPAKMEDINLRAMRTIADQFGCPVGYSDHSLGAEVAIGAVALGASVIEKHITLDTGMPGPDHAASLEIADFANFVASIRSLERAMGDGVKEPRESEFEVRAVARRSIMLARHLSAGTALAESDLIMMRPAGGISPARMDEVVGRTVRADLQQGHVLDWGDLS